MMKDLEDLFWDLEIEFNNEIEINHKNESNKNKEKECQNFQINQQINSKIIQEIEIKFSEVINDGIFETIGKELWEASLILCCIILKNITKFCFFNVLELGSGLGIPSLLLIILKQRYQIKNSQRSLGDVILTDFDDEILFNLTKTIQQQFTNEIIEIQSQTTFQVQIQKLDWNDYQIEENLDTNIVKNNDKSFHSCQILYGSELIYTNIQEGLFSLLL